MGISVLLNSTTRRFFVDNLFPKFNACRTFHAADANNPRSSIEAPKDLCAPQRTELIRNFLGEYNGKLRRIDDILNRMMIER